MQPIDMILHCPNCGYQHIDKADPDNCEDCGHSESAHFNAGERNICASDDTTPIEVTIGVKNLCDCEDFNPWLNPPHKSHRCHHCNHVWRPFEYPTNGIEDSSVERQQLEETAAMIREVAMVVSYERAAVCGHDLVLQLRDGQLAGTLAAWRRYLRELRDGGSHTDTLRHDAWVPAIDRSE